jgi:hypothetical protein
MPGPEDTAPGALPPWLDAATLRAMRDAAAAALPWGGGPAAAAAARDAALAHHPALPLPMIEEAAALVVPDPAPPLPEGEAAAPEDVANSLAYALRFDERGRPRRAGLEMQSHLAAEALVRHLLRSNFVVLRRRPPPAHPGW